MSVIPSLVLKCDMCPLRFGPLEVVGTIAIRHEARKEGWTRRRVKGRNGFADLCPWCKKRSNDAFDAARKP